MDHGYVSYTRGCRCEVCQKAKADYMRKRRADAREKAQEHTFWAEYGGGPWGVGATRYVANIENHGTRYGYEERGCRCPECSAARAASDSKYVYNNWRPATKEQGT